VNQGVRFNQKERRDIPNEYSAVNSGA
jgi:hypothetical protein